MSETTDRSARRLKASEHLAYGAVWFCLLAVFAAGAWMHPDPSGLGTHMQLHLPPCGFYEVFHKPCPSCGMTTAFAWMMHGHPLRAWQAQPAGVAVFAAALFLFLYIPWAWFQGEGPLHVFDAPAFLVVTMGLIALILVVWIFRVI